MRVDLGIWERLRRLIVFLLIAAAAVAVVYSYLPLIRDNERLRRQVLDKEAELQVELQRSNILRREIIASVEDPRTVERLARERLSFGRSNELILRFESTPATNGVPGSQRGVP
jgi:hypothetical protein